VSAAGYRGCPTLEELVRWGATAEQAQTLHLALEEALALREPPLSWRALTQGPAGKPAALNPSVSFSVHRALFEWIFAPESWPPKKGPPQAWIPGPQEQNQSNLARLLKDLNLHDYDEAYRWSVNDPTAFANWAAKRFAGPFMGSPTGPSDLSDPRSPVWFPGARMNCAASCLASSSPDAPAIIEGSADGTLQEITWAELREQVEAIASGLRAQGYKTGDAVALYLPMTADAVALYLGIVWAGMVVVSIADSMAPEEIATRLRLSGAVGVFTVFSAARGPRRLPLYETLLAAHPPKVYCLSVPARGSDAGAHETLRSGDMSFEAFLAAGQNGPQPDPHVATDGQGHTREQARGPSAHRCSAQDTLNILFSSGTTGDPKAIPWDHTTPLKAAADGALHLDIQAGDVVAWPTNLGWMMGPWLIFAALMNGATIALFIDAPTTRGFGAFVEAARVTVLGLVPSIVKAWRSDDRMVGFDWSKLRCFGSTGEASNPDDYLYLMMLAGYRPIIEYCGGTELGGGYVTGSLLHPASPATFTTPALGTQMLILDESSQPSDRGEVFLGAPSLGQSTRLLHRDHKAVYFEGTPEGPNGLPLRRHGDQLERLPGGSFRALGRMDDTMNLGGIKVSAAELERVVERVEGVSRCAAVAVSPQNGGPSRLVVFVSPCTTPQTASSGPSVVANRAELKRRLQLAISQHLNPLFRISEVIELETLPVTASNKVMRRSLRARLMAPADVVSHEGVSSADKDADTDIDNHVEYNKSPA